MQITITVNSLSELNQLLKKDVIGEVKSKDVIGEVKSKVVLIKNNKRNKRNRWTDEEDLLLSELYSSTYKIRSIAKRLKRTYWAVTSRIVILEKTGLLKRRFKRIKKLKYGAIDTAIQ